MILVKPSFNILTISDIKLIELAGRTCYKSQDSITNDSAAKFVKMIDERGHHAVLEHSFASVRIICDRGVSHEIVRHRLFSFAQESTRYCNYSKKKFNGVTFIIPSWLNLKEGVYNFIDEKNTVSPYECSTNSIFDLPEISLQTGAAEWLQTCYKLEQEYLLLIEKGWSPQQARTVLPNSLKTEIVVSGNFREWKHFFELRGSEAAHPQVREIALPLSKEFEQRVPEIQWRENQ